MAGYAQLPGYTVPNALNFDGFNQGVDALSKGITQNRTNALNMDIGQRIASGDRKGAAGVANGAGQLETGLWIDKYAQQSEHLDRQARKEDADWFGNQAMAVANLPPGPQRDAAWRNVVSKHPNAGSLDPMHLDPMSGPTVVSAEYGKFKNALDEEKKRADIALTRAHTGYYNSAAALKGAQAEGGGAPTRAQPIWDLDENGKLVDRSIQTATYGGGAPQGGYLNVGGGLRPQGQGQPQPGGPIQDAQPTTAAERARKEAEGIRDTLPGDAANKLKREADVQAVFTSLHGKAQPGMKWAENGAQIPIEGAKSNQTQTTLNNVLKVSKQNIESGFNTLLDGNMISRAAGQKLDMGAMGQAYADLEFSVRGAVYALSGKNATNAEFNGFLTKFIPKIGDTADRIVMKKDRLTKFLNSLETKTSKGVLTGDEAVWSAGGADGGRSGAPAPAGPVKVNTPADAAKLPPGTKFMTPDGQIRERH